MVFIVLTKIEVYAIAILIPVTAIVLTFIFSQVSKLKSDNTVLNALSYIATPLPLQPLVPQSSDQSIKAQKRHFRTQIVYRLLFIYGAIALFVIGNFIATFYVILADLTLEANQATPTGLLPRTWSGIGIDTPFNGGWYGSLPWIGYIPSPPLKEAFFRETWNWIFFTGAITDNDSFLNDNTTSMIVRTVIIGLIFLLPLAVRSVRESFIPSFFLFSIGMFTVSKGIVSCFSEAWNLVSDNFLLQYGAITIPTDSYEYVVAKVVANSYLFPLFYVLLFLTIIFVLIAGELWRTHYPQHQHSQYWVLLVVAVSFWVSIFGTMFY